MRTTRKSLALLVTLLAAAFIAAGCGGDDKKKQSHPVDDPNPDNTNFHVGADATTFGGPVPLAIKFKATPFHAKGQVHYRWRFDDGTWSEEQEPVHHFPRAGYYQVLMEARDSKGSDAWNLIVGAWPPKLWEYRQRTKGPITKGSIRRLQKGQALRTAARRHEQLKKTRARAAQYRVKPGT
jgi:PKD domain-containing protein